MSDLALGARAAPLEHADAYAASAPRQWWLVCVLVVMGLLAIIDKTVLSLLFDSIREDLRLSDTQMSVIYGLSFALANVAFTLPAGWLADRWSRRGLLASGAIVWSLMTGVFGLGRSFTQLFVTRAAVGFSEAVLYPSCLSMLRAALLERARALSAETGESAREFGECLYQAQTWDRPRRVIIKGEVAYHPDRDPKDNPRFLVTNLKQTPGHVYRKIYCGRGEIENRIKELHYGLELDRNSCTAFQANQFRVTMTVAAYALLQELRTKARGTSLARAQVHTLQTHLLKLSARVTESVRRIVLHLPETFAFQPEWTIIARRLGAVSG